jgi:hypothetical protein
VACGLVAWVVIFFRGAVLQGKTLFARDINMVWLPQVEVFVRCIAGGSWPLWDPYRGFGQPLLADPRAEILYPITWLNLILPPWAYYTLFVVVHLVLAGMGLHELGRRWELSRAAAFLAAAVWVASGPLLSLASVWHHLAAAAWMPWVFVAAEEALTRPSLRGVLAWGAAVAIQVLAGSPDVTVLTLSALALHVLLSHVVWRRGGGDRNRAILAASAAALALGLGLTAAQWLPTLDVARRSARWGLAGEDRLTWSLHPAGLVETVFPWRWAELPLLPSYVASLLESKEPWLSSIYLGSAAAALAVTAAARPSPRRRFLVSLLAVALLMALGRHTPVYEIVVSLLPPLRSLRYPVKAMLLASFAWALLVGMGFDAWNAGATSKRAGVVTAVLLALIGLTAAAMPPSSLLVPGATVGATTPRLAITAAICLATAVVGWAGARPPAVVMALVLADLLLTHRNLHPTAPRELFGHRPEVLRSLEAGSRVYVYDYSIGTRNQIRSGTHPGFRYRLARLPAGWSPAAALVLGVHMYLNPPTGERWGVFGSYDLDILGFSPRPVAELTDLLRDVEATPAHLRLLQMGGVSDALALHPQAWWRDLIPVATVPGLFEEPIQVFKVPNPLPRTYAVDGVRVADGADALRLAVDPTLELTRELILPDGQPNAPRAEFRGSSRILDDRPDRVRLEAELSHPGYVVLLDGWDAGWRATVDGSDSPVLRANLAFRAVRVPAGRHLVEYAYRPRPVAAGLAVSAVCLLAGIALAARPA